MNLDHEFQQTLSHVSAFASVVGKSVRGEVGLRGAAVLAAHREALTPARAMVAKGPSCFARRLAVIVLDATEQAIVCVETDFPTAEALALLSTKIALLDDARRVAAHGLGKGDYMVCVTEPDRGYVGTVYCFDSESLARRKTRELRDLGELVGIQKSGQGQTILAVDQPL